MSFRRKTEHEKADSHVSVATGLFDDARAHLANAVGYYKDAEARHRALLASHRLQADAAREGHEHATRVHQRISDLLA